MVYCNILKTRSTQRVTLTSCLERTLTLASIQHPDPTPATAHAHLSHALHGPPVIADHAAAELPQQVHSASPGRLRLRYVVQPAIAQVVLLRVAQVDGALRPANPIVKKDVDIRI